MVADIAHELRTPLTIIRGQTEAIVDGLYPADAEHMAPILAATESLEMLVNDLSTLTLLEGGTLRLRREPIDVDVLVNGTLDAFRPEASAAGVQLIEAVDPHLPALDADPARIRGVLGNLVSNALAPQQRGAAASVSRGSPTTDGFASPCATTAKAFPPICCRACSIGSSKARGRPDPGSGSRSSETSSRRTGGPSRP